MSMTLQETLLAYSEWLDGEGLVKAQTRKDTRTHDDLAREFIEDWESTDTRATLAGRKETRTGNVDDQPPLPGTEVPLPAQQS